MEPLSIKYKQLQTRLIGAVVLLLFIGLSSCGAKKYSLQEKALLDSLVAAKNITIQANWALPLGNDAGSVFPASQMALTGSNANRISLSGAHALTVAGDRVMAYLPYFGTRQIGGGYTDDTGISFDGVPDNYEVRMDEASQAYEITFSITENNENYQVYLTLFPSKRASIAINSSKRQSIKYQGLLVETPPKKD